MLSKLNFILKDDGILFMYTPNANIQLPKAKIKKILFGIKTGVYYLGPKDHLNIYSPKIISRVLSQNKFNYIKFVHLKPIQSVSGSRSLILKFIKNIWFYVSKVLFLFSFEKINFDNLFVIAKKTKT